MKMSRRQFAIGGLTALAGATGVVAYLTTDDSTPPPATTPELGAAIPQPYVRWALHDNDEGWQAGPRTPDITVASANGWLRGTGSGEIELSSFAEGYAMRTNWELDDRPNDDRLTVSAHVASAHPFAKLAITMTWNDDGRVQEATSYEFAVPCNRDIDVDTWWHCRGNAPKDVLRKVVGVRVRAAAEGALTLQIRDVRQPPSTRSYGAPATGVAKMFFADRPERSRATDGLDPYAEHVVAKLDAIAAWGRTNNRGIHIGEWAWPKESGSGGQSDQSSLVQWQGLATAWLRRADALAIPYTPWGESAYWAGSKRPGATNYGSYPDASFFCGSSNYDRVGDLPRVVDAMKPLAAPLRRHLGAVPGIRPSINVIGGAFVYLRDGSEYSSTNIGVRGREYFVENPETIDYLHQVGYRVFRMPFRWDRVMRSPNEPQLDASEWGYVREGIEHILSLPDTAVIVDEHSGGQFWISPEPSNRFVPAKRHTVDGPDGVVGIDDFVNFWSLVSDDLAAHSNRLIYEITNEPHGDDTSAFNVRRYTQAVVSALRAKGDTTFCLIPGFPYDNITTATAERNHPFPWIEDPAGSHRHAYTFHQYMDSEMSGRYALSYQAELKKFSS